MGVCGRGRMAVNFQKHNPACSCAAPLLDLDWNRPHSSRCYAEAPYSPRCVALLRSKYASKPKCLTSIPA